MVSTRKVARLSAGIIAIDCVLATTATAGLIGQGVGTMSEFLSATLTLVVVMAALNVILVRLHIKDWREKHQRGKDPVSDLLGDTLERDLDAKAMLTKIAVTLGRHDEALTPLIEDYQLRKAEREADDLKPL